MDNMNKRIYGLCEAAILVLLGVAILWFALGGRYGLLMHVRFRWLTVTGAALLLVMGLVALGAVQKRRGLNTFIFGLMLLITLVGRPYLPGADSLNLLETPLQAGLWDQIDQTRFPRMALQNLYSKEGEEVFRTDASFSTIGMVKRLEELDSHNSFALMTSMMFCCIADALVVGFRVPAEDLESIQDGQWILVCGKLVSEEEEITLPNFRFARATLSSVHKTYYIRPEKIMSYDRVAQLPLLTDQLKGQTNHLFVEALQASGVWQDLEAQGPFTVFVPVDQALETFNGVSLEALTPGVLKQLVSSHIVRGKFFSRDLMERDTVETLNGRVLQVELVNGKLRIHQSRLLFKDAEARNGVIHYIYPAIPQEESDTGR